MSAGLDVLVQLVMEAITTSPSWMNSRLPSTSTLALVTSALP